MKHKELAERIGNIDDRLIQEAACFSGGGKEKESMFKRIVAAAAVLALMVCSGTVGALAFARETVVEIPVEQETVKLDQIGLTLILPDEWKDRYAVQVDEDGTYTVFSKAIKEKNAEAGLEMGMLFYIMKWDAAMTSKEFEDSGLDLAACQYLFSTSGSTYVLYYASDVQYDPEDPAQEMEFQDMTQGIKDIQFVVDNAVIW